MQEYNQYRYYDYFVAACITVLLCATLIGPAKITEIMLPGLGMITVGAGIVFLPLFYTLGKVVSEVYGREHNRKITWIGFGALAFAATLSCLMLLITPASDAFSSEYQKHLEAMFGNTPRIVAASMIAFLCGSHVNGYVITMLGNRMHGRQLWMRAFSATLCSQFIDTSLFCMIAFYGIWPYEQLVAVIIAQYGLKICCEIVLSPATCSLVRALKKQEAQWLADHQNGAYFFKPQNQFVSGS